MVARDFRSRYLNSVLGSLWAILNPLTQILIYTLIFSQVMRTKLPGVDDTLGYSIYMCAGILPWQFFVEVLSREQNVFLEHGTLLKKVNFPRSSLPVYTFLSAGINFIILYLLFLVFLVVVGKWPGLSLLAVFPLLILQIGLAVGVGIFLGTLNVFFRDVGHIIGIIMQFWFWLTPIVYPVQAIPDKFHWLLFLNPMAIITQDYQKIFLYRAWPDWENILPIFYIVIVFLALGYWTFIKLDKEMVDEL